MTVFICLDDNGGMMFNNRRQSRDSAVVKKIIELSDGGRLLMNSYSSKLFCGYDVTVCKDFLEKSRAGDHCFVENADLSQYSDKIKKLVIFKWNKIYPSDRKLDISLNDRYLESTFEIVGTSHDKITCEVWAR